MKATQISSIVALAAALALGSGAALAQTPPQAAPGTPAVGGQPGSAGADSALANAVKSKLAGLKGVDGAAISVKTSGGMVTLTGSVAKQSDIDQIESAVHDVSGVQGVDVSGVQAGAGR